MMLILIFIGLATSHVSASRRNQDNVNDNLAVKGDGPNLLVSEPLLPKDTNHSNSNVTNWLANFMKSRNAFVQKSIVDESLEDENDEGHNLSVFLQMPKHTAFPPESVSPKIQDLQSISYAILNFFNAKNNTASGFSMKAKTYLEQIYKAIDMYFYHKNNTGINFGEYIEADAYLEEIFLAILNYRDSKLEPDLDIDITYVTNQITNAINKYKEFKKKQDKIQQLQLQEDLRIRLQAIYETLNEFIRNSEAGQSKYEDEVAFLDEVFKMLLKYRKYRLNNIEMLQSLGMFVKLESEDTFRMVFSAIALYKKHKDTDADNETLAKDLYEIFTKLTNHLKRVTYLPSPLKTDADSLVLQIFSALVRFHEILQKHNAVEILKAIIVMVDNARPTTNPNDVALVEIFKVLLSYYQNFPQVVNSDQSLKDVFLAFVNYIQHWNQYTQGPNIYYEKIFSTIELYLNRPDRTGNGDLEIQALRHILSRLLPYKNDLHAAYMKEIMNIILNFTNSVTDRPIENNEVSYKILKLIVRYFQSPSQPTVDTEIQSVITSINNFLNILQHNDPNQTKNNHIELVNVIREYIKTHKSDQNEMVQNWIQILKIVLNYQNPYNVATEKITDLTIYLTKLYEKIKNYLVYPFIVKDLVQIFNDLTNVETYITNGDLYEIDPEPLQDVFDSIDAYTQLLMNNCKECNSEILLENVYYNIQMYLSKAQKANPIDDANLSLLQHILEELLAHHRGDPEVPKDAVAQYLDAIFHVIRHNKQDDPKDVLNKILKVIVNVKDRNPVNANIDINTSLVFWRELFAVIINEHSVSLPGAYLKNIFYLLLEYLNQPFAHDRYLTNISEIVVKYENHKNHHPSEVVVIYLDDRPVVIKIIEILLNPGSVNIHNLEPDLIKLYKIIFSKTNPHDQPFVKTLVKLIMKFYNIILHENQNEVYKTILVYLNLILEKIKDLAQNLVLDEKTVVKEIIKVILTQSDDDIQDVDLNEIANDVIEIIHLIESGKTQRVLVKILNVLAKYVNAVGENIIRVLYLLPIDDNQVLIKILIELLNTHQFDNVEIDPSNSKTILTKLLLELTDTITNESQSTDIRTLILKFITNIIKNINDSTKNPEVKEVLILILKIFDIHGPGGTFPWQEVVGVLDLITSGQAKPGTDLWIQIIQIFKNLNSANKRHPHTDPWIEIAKILKLIADDDPQTLIKVQKFIDQISNGKQINAEDSFSILKIIFILLERNNKEPGPVQGLLKIIINLIENPPHTSNFEPFQQLLNTLHIIISIKSNDPEIQIILKIVINFLEKPQSDTKAQRIKDILTILKLLLQTKELNEWEWKEILIIVITLLADNSPSGNPWEELLEILKPLIRKHPEHGPNLEKALRLIISIINNPDQNVEVPYKELLKTIALIIKQSTRAGDDLNTVVNILISFLKEIATPELQPVIAGITKYLQLVLVNNGKPVFQKNLKLLSQTVITVDKYVNIPDQELNGDSGMILQTLVKQKPLKVSSHYAYIDDKKKTDAEVLAEILKGEVDTSK